MKTKLLALSVRVVDLDRHPVETAKVSCGEIVGKHLGKGLYQLSEVPKGSIVIESQMPLMTRAP